MDDKATHRPETAERPTTSIVGEILTNLSELIRNEINLARAEVSENMSRALTAIGLLVGAIVIALVALNVLAAALVAALAAAGLAGGWAALLVGCALAIIAALLVRKGTNDLRMSSLAPTRTAADIKQSARTIKEKYNA